jgi:1,4-dihydroxy-2-naphthoyl-CoA hydrolase
MRIWFADVRLEHIVNRGANTLVDHLDIEFTEVGPDYLRATMPVDNRTRQIMGVLHGGASAALAETIGSFAANMCVDNTRFMCVGRRSTPTTCGRCKAGWLRPRPAVSHWLAQPVWHIEIHDERQRLVCVSRLTVAVVERRAAAEGNGNGNGG